MPMSASQDQEEPVNLQALREELQHLVEANTTLHLLVSDTANQLAGAVLAQTCDITSALLRLSEQIARLERAQNQFPRRIT